MSSNPPARPMADATKYTISPVTMTDILCPEGRFKNECAALIDLQRRVEAEIAGNKGLIEPSAFEKFWTEFLQEKNNAAFKLVVDEKIVGFVCVSSVFPHRNLFAEHIELLQINEEYPWKSVHTLTIDPEQQGKGYGSALFTHIVNIEGPSSALLVAPPAKKNLVIDFFRSRHVEFANMPDQPNVKIGIVNLKERAPTTPAM